MGARGPQPGEGGRPPTPIDTATLRRVASLGATIPELATALGVPSRTLQHRIEADPEIREALEEGRNAGRLTLRRMQWQQAQSGNPTMLIWLGKQMLNQRDRAELSGDPDRPIQWVIRGPAPVSDTQEWLRIHAPKDLPEQPEVVIEGTAESAPPDPPALPPAAPPPAPPEPPPARSPAEEWLEQHRPRDYGFGR